MATSNPQATRMQTWMRREVTATSRWCLWCRFGFCRGSSLPPLDARPRSTGSTCSTGQASGLMSRPTGIRRLDTDLRAGRGSPYLLVQPVVDERTPMFANPRVVVRALAAERFVVNPRPPLSLCHLLFLPLAPWFEARFLGVAARDILATAYHALARIV